MASKFGNIAERLIGARSWFVPDGSNLGTEMDPEMTGPTAKPTEDADWEDYDLGRTTSVAYDPVTQERARDFFSKERLRYIRETKREVLADAFNATMVDYAETLFDELMFGLGTPIVDDTPQPIFANTVREKKGWVRLMRWNEDKSVLCQAEFHIKLSIQTNPPDSNEPGSPVWRMEHTGEADDALEVITFNPAPAP